MLVGRDPKFQRLGVNFLFAISWTEVLDVTGKLVEAAHEFESKA